MEYKDSAKSTAGKTKKTWGSNSNQLRVALPIILIAVFIGVVAYFEDAGMAVNTAYTPNYELESYSVQFGNVAELDQQNQIAILEIIGPIMDAMPVLEQVQLIQNTEAIKGVILYVDSPGGGVHASHEIFESLANLNAQKKIFAYFASTAASGGYYISMGADKIFSGPSTITGSIGVILPLMNIRKLAENMGIEYTPVYSGKYKNMGNVWSALTDEERELAQIASDDIYEQFAGLVAEKRGLSPSQINKIAQGQVFTGRQALKNNLVDEISTFEGTVNSLATELDLENPQLVSLRFNAENDYLKYLNYKASAWFKQAFATFFAPQF